MKVMGRLHLERAKPWSRLTDGEITLEIGASCAPALEILPSAPLRSRKPSKRIRKRRRKVAAGGVKCVPPVRNECAFLETKYARVRIASAYVCAFSANC
jgi:hypothetical protein